MSQKLHVLAAIAVTFRQGIFILNLNSDACIVDLQP